MAKEFTEFWQADIGKAAEIFAIESARYIAKNHTTALLEHTKDNSTLILFAEDKPPTITMCTPIVKDDGATWDFEFDLETVLTNGWELAESPEELITFAELFEKQAKIYRDAAEIMKAKKAVL